MRYNNLLYIPIKNCCHTYCIRSAEEWIHFYYFCTESHDLSYREESSPWCTLFFFRYWLSLVNSYRIVLKMCMCMTSSFVISHCHHQFSHTWSLYSSGSVSVFSINTIIGDHSGTVTLPLTFKNCPKQTDMCQATSLHQYWVGYCIFMSTEKVSYNKC